MLVLHEWLKDYLGDSIPSPEKIEELLTFHSFEIEGREKVGEHEIIDIDVLPNRSSDCLCHRGIAREIASLIDAKLQYDPFQERPEMPSTEKLAITIADPAACGHFDLALISGVKVGPSPDWLSSRLKALGQRSINNVVDATNYVMLALGQPLHAYDGEKFERKDGSWHVGVRFGREGESVQVLTGETYELDGSIQLIVNSATDAPAGIAGIKGGAYAEIDEHTTTLILEAAHFDPQVTRKASQKLKLQTDASKRFENNVSSEIAPYALAECVKLITETAGGTCEGYAHAHPTVIKNPAVNVPLEHVNSLLGLSLSAREIEAILERLGFAFEAFDSGWKVTAPFERTDIQIPEDVIEEIGRVHGYAHVESVLPEAAPLTEINARQYYSEKIRMVLAGCGFSEVITSSFRKKDVIQLQNALASDKGYLRSTLRKNIAEALDKNIQNSELLGLTDIRIFEIGTVFTKSENKVAEHVSVALGVRTKKQGYTPNDDATLKEAVIKLEEALGIKMTGEIDKGVIEFNLTEILKTLPAPSAYEPHQVSKEIQYRPFSTYPFVVRDIALWVPENISASEVEAVLDGSAGELRVRTDLFDEFKKDGRVSYAFRLVFQSNERTLTDSEVNTIMDRVTSAAGERGWEAR